MKTNFTIATLTVATWIVLLTLAYLGLTMHEGEFLILSATARWRKKTVIAHDVIEITASETKAVELVN